MHKEKFNFWRFLFCMLAVWSGVLLAHFCAILLWTGAVAVFNALSRAYAIVSRSQEVIISALIALVVAIICSLIPKLKNNFNAKKGKNISNDDENE